MPFVLDASVALCWLLPFQATPASTRIHAHARRGQAVVPPLWHIEVANQLGLKSRSGKISPADLEMALQLIDDLNLRTDLFVWTSKPEIMDLMNRFRLTAYDATYLETAMRLSLPLATFDGELAAAAVIAGVELVR